MTVRELLGEHLLKLFGEARFRLLEITVPDLSSDVDTAVVVPQPILGELDVAVQDRDLVEEGADEPEVRTATPEQPVAETDSDSDSDEANADSAAETAPVTSPGAETETPAAATQRPVTKRARKLREKRLREAAKREARAARMPR